MRFAFTLHNLVGHPLMEVLHLLGLERASAWVHDIAAAIRARGGGK